MKKTIIFLLISIIAIYLTGQSSLWMNHLGNTSSDNARSIDINGNNLHVVGNFTGILNYGSGSLSGAGGQDIFYARYDISGNLNLIRAVGGSSFDEGEDIHVDNAQNVLITGLHSDFEGSNVYIVKYDANGTLLWTVKELVSGIAGAGTAIATDGSGAIYITGYFNGTAYFNDGASSTTVLESSGLADVFIAKYSSGGSLLWARSEGGVGDDYATEISVLNDGTFFITGFFNSTAEFGSSTIISNGANDVFLGKYNSSGSLQWIASEGGSSNDEGTDIEIASNGDIVMVGNKNMGGSNGFVSRYGTFGNQVFSSILSGIEEANGLTISVGGEYIVTGKANNADDIVTACYAGSTSQWSLAFTGGGDDWGTDVATNNNGTVFLVGSFYNTVSSGSQSVSSYGSSDGIIAAIDPESTSGICLSEALFNDFGKISIVSFPPGQFTVSSGATCSTYTDWTSTEIDVFRDEVVPFEVTMGSCNNNSTNFTKAFKVFVDWNDDEDFDDSGEQVFVSPEQGNGIVQGGFVVPSSASLGPIRLRIVCMNMIDGLPDEDSADDILPCGSYTYGETEDYTLVVNSYVPPSITSIDPDQGHVGEEMLIIGNNFTLGIVNGVKFGNSPALSANLIDENTISAIPNIGTISSPVTISTIYGENITSAETYNILCTAQYTDFENVQIPSGSLNFNGDNSNTFQLVNLNGPNGSNYCLYMENYGYDSPGEFDGLILANLCPEGSLFGYLQFDYAYTYFSDGTNTAIDNLIVFDYDTGNIIWAEGGNSLATAPPQSTAFIPSVTEWETKIIDISSLTQDLSSRINLAIWNQTGNGNNLFIDNIDIIFTSSPLPIDKLIFNGSSVDDFINLTWHTENEIDVEKFLVEKSGDGVDYTQLTETDSKGNGNHDYFYKDEAPYIGENYYRLRSVDFDGALGDYKIVYINHLPTNIESGIEIFPNPSSGRFIVKNHLGKPGTFELFNTKNQLIKVLTINEEDTPFSFQQLLPGVYYGKFHLGRSVIVEKIIIQ
ncbi:GEVED domain-containing protein [Lewinella cohaerens]|uniref:GEVED domain-containing protein n=1 Tax=Lewinella cohaerens TaxID=70995 RepID=UPI0003781B0B|nr:GEVED domain-containing protein [Lewinella cohaerens]